MDILTEISHFAPTADTLGVNLAFLFAARNNWVLQAGHVTTAFLSGVYDNRSLYLKPPKEGLPAIDQNDLLEMQKGVYLFMGFVTLPDCSGDDCGKCWFHWESLN